MFKFRFLLLAVFFVGSLFGFSQAYEGDDGNESVSWVTGKVQKVTKEKIDILESSGYGEDSESYSFLVDAKVSLSGNLKKVTDIKVGDEIEVGYLENGDDLIAKEISSYSGDLDESVEENDDEEIEGYGNQEDSTIE